MYFILLLFLCVLPLQGVIVSYHFTQGVAVGLFLLMPFQGELSYCNVLITRIILSNTSSGLQLSSQYTRTPSEDSE